MLIANDMNVILARTNSSRNPTCPLLFFQEIGIKIRSKGMASMCGRMATCMMGSGNAICATARVPVHIPMATYIQASSLLCLYLRMCVCAREHVSIHVRSEWGQVAASNPIAYSPGARHALCTRHVIPTLLHVEPQTCVMYIGMLTHSTYAHVQIHAHIRRLE